MQARFTATLRRALMPAAAVLALFAAVPAAQADQQETSAQIDNALSWRAATSNGIPGAYAQAPRPDRYTRGHRTYR